MSGKITKKDIRNSDRSEECKLFCAILRNEIPLRGLVIHSKGEGGTGKTTLLKMFENECANSSLSKPTIVLFFTAHNRFLDWQMILNKTVERLNPEHFKTYTQLRNAYAGSSKKAGKSKPTVTYETHIHNVQGPVHTGSGDIKSTQISESISEQFREVDSPEGPPRQEDIRTSLTQAFLQDLKQHSEQIQLVWLIDTTERLDESTVAWLTDIYDQIADGNIEEIIMVVAGQNLVCYEPYWVDKIEELYIGNFN